VEAKGRAQTAPTTPTRPFRHLNDLDDIHAEIAEKLRAKRSRPEHCHVE
jgi:hypothetical protein